VRKGWKVQTLGDACSFQRGLTYSEADEVEYSNNAVLRANNIDLATNNINLGEIRYISDDIDIPESKKVKTGSIIVCTASRSKSHLGKVAFIDRDYDYAFGGFMGQLTPKPHLDPRYLFYVMTSTEYKSFIEKLSNGMNINNLKFSDLQLFSLVVPPLPEQKRIAAILDQTSEVISAAVANAEKNLANARELFDRYLNSVFTQNGEGWVEKPLGDVCDLLNGFAFKSSDAVPGSQTQLVRMGNLWQLCT
jgi:type I restriction enzyme S subunit